MQIPDTNRILYSLNNKLGKSNVKSDQIMIKYGMVNNKRRNNILIWWIRSTFLAYNFAYNYTLNEWKDLDIDSKKYPPCLRFPKF